MARTSKEDQAERVSKMLEDLIRYIGIARTNALQGGRAGNFKSFLYSHQEKISEYWQGICRETEGVSRQDLINRLHFSAVALGWKDIQFNHILSEAEKLKLPTAS